MVNRAGHLPTDWEYNTQLKVFGLACVYDLYIFILMCES